MPLREEGRWQARGGEGRWHVADSLVGRRRHAQAYRGTLHEVSKHHSRRGREAARSSKSQGSVEPLCAIARIKGANRWGPEGKFEL